MAELKPYKHGYYLWKYVPSTAAAACFMLLFLSITIAHCWRLYKTKKWFCIPFVIGGYMEFIGYATRIAAHSKTDRLMPYAIQSSYILMAPILFAATIYMTLGRIIRSIRAESHSFINPNWLTKIFVLGDILTLCIQAGASGLMFNQSTVDLGNGILIGALVLQIVMFGLFGATAVLFQRRLRQAPTKESYLDVPWKQSLYMLYTVSALVMTRSIFRVIEYIGGQNGYLMAHEWTLYIFDAVPMWSVMAVFYIWYPARLVPAPTATLDDESLNLQTDVIGLRNKRWSTAGTSSIDG